MCLTIPAKISYIDDIYITVEDRKGFRKLKSVIPEKIAIGDWVLYNSDIAVQKIDADDAREIINLLESKRDFDLTKLDPEFVGILKSRSQRKLYKQEIVRLLETNHPDELEALFSEANIIRQSALKDFFCIHGIIEFSNYCRNECSYCGLRINNLNIKRYRMSTQEIAEVINQAVTVKGYKLIVLQSGDDLFYTDKMLIDLIREIKKNLNVFIFLSIGERGKESYQRIKEAGANGVLFRFETSNPAIYTSLHQEQKIEERISDLKAMQELGYYLATGFLIGLPGQTISDIADDIILTTELGIQMVSVGPFIPCEDTPLKLHPAGDALLTLKVLSVCRLALPRVKIPVTTALETISQEEGRRLALSSGANSLMFNLTPEKHRNDYKIYPHRYHGNEQMWERYGLSQEKLSYKMLEEKMAEAF